jgi:long-subunit fatty acid transport protein
VRKFIPLCIVVSALLLVRFPDPGAAQGVDIPIVTIASSPSPVGSGARAAGYGNAFIAIADDATAASWNPGGLVQLERPEFSAVGDLNVRVEDFSGSPGAAGGPSGTTTTASLNYFSVVVPFSLFQLNMAASVNFQRTMDFDRDLGFGIIQDQLPVLELHQDVQVRQRGALNTVSPAFCLQITPRLSLGAAVNVWLDDIFHGRAWESHTSSQGAGSINTGGGTGTPFTMRYRRDDEFSGITGVNCTAGVLWNVWRGLRIGAVLKTPFSVGATRKYSWSLLVEDPANPGSPSSALPQSVIVPLTTEEVQICFPWSYGIGLSYRFSDFLIASVDVTRVEWGDFVIVQTDPLLGIKVERSPFTGTDIRLVPVHGLQSVRAGVEYVIARERFAVPLRGGFFYDPLPSSSGGSDDYFGFSAGTGFSMDRFSCDLAYMFRYGSGLEGDLYSGVEGSRLDVMDHRFLFSLIFYL